MLNCVGRCWWMRMKIAVWHVASFFFFFFEMGILFFGGTFCPHVPMWQVFGDPSYSCSKLHCGCSVLKIRPVFSSHVHRHVDYGLFVKISVVHFFVPHGSPYWVEQPDFHSTISPSTTLWFTWWAWISCTYWTSAHASCKSASCY